MKYIIILSVLLSGCATVPPVWQQELNNLHRQWRTYDDQIIQPNDPLKNMPDQFDPLRNGTVTGNSCQFR
jgi:hypothetical protein